MKGSSSISKSLSLINYYSNGFTFSKQPHCRHCIYLDLAKTIRFHGSHHRSILNSLLARADSSRAFHILNICTEKTGNFTNDKAHDIFVK